MLLEIHIYAVPLYDCYDSVLFRSQLTAEIILKLLLLKTMILSHCLVPGFFQDSFIMSSTAY